MSEGQEKRETPVNKNKKHEKEKPWDHDGIDHWANPAFTKEDNPNGLLEESSFLIMFPTYREKYLREVWPLVSKALKEVGLACELNLVEGSMTVRTTRKTFDPYIIVKARDLLKLLARSVPVSEALKILEDTVQCDIIQINRIIRNKEKFVKRRQRLLGPNGATLKALQLLTGCYMSVQGNTVSAMGPYQGLKQVRRVVEDCIKNVHPVYHIRVLMMKRELAKDPAMANENWERFLPKWKKKNVARRKPKVVREKKAYTPFPPPQLPSKVDLQLESGEYFLNPDQKAARAQASQDARQAERTREAQQRRQASFVAPKEAKEVPAKAGGGEPSDDLKAMAKKLKKTSEAEREKKKRGRPAEAFLVQESHQKTEPPSKKKLKKHSSNP